MRSANLCIYYNDSLRTAADTLLSEIRILLQARLVVNKNLATWNDVSSPKRSIGCCTPELMTFDYDDQKAIGSRLTDGFAHSAYSGKLEQAAPAIVRSRTTSLLEVSNAKARTWHEGPLDTDYEATQQD